MDNHSKNLSPIIEPDELHDLLHKTSRVFILDCTWLGLPIFNARDPKIEFNKIRIPCSNFFDLDECCDVESSLPHMMPTESHFASYLSTVCKTSANHFIEDSVNRIDLENDYFIVYDTIGIWSSPRVWLMLTLFGSKNCFILNGGLCSWINRNYTTDTSPMTTLKNSSSIEVVGINFNPAIIATFAKIQQFLNVKETSILIDARPSGRFNGTDPEPRFDVPSGHIPGSLNIPWNSILEVNCIKRDRHTLSGEFENKDDVLIDYQYYRYMKTDSIKKILSDKLLLDDENQKLIFLCGSGVSAVILLVAAIFTKIGDWSKNVFLYDGSWTEWKLKEMGKL